MLHRRKQTIVYLLQTSQKNTLKILSNAYIFRKLAETIKTRTRSAVWSMIKKITIDELKKGMYIHDFGRSWLNRPFLFSKVLVKDKATIRKIKSYGIKELYIDTRRGDDVSSEPAVKNFSKVVQKIEKKEETSAPPSVPEIREKLSKELKKALIIKSETRRLVEDIARDVKLGRQVNILQAEDVVSNIFGSLARNQDALFTLISFKNKHEYTFNHSVNVAVLMTAFCKAAGMSPDEVKMYGTGAILHDVGKARVADEIINKPDNLTPEEFEEIKKHPGHGRDIVESIDGITDEIIGIIYEHHENIDGSGYPRGLKGVEISYGGRITSIIDVYDALTSDRVYHLAVDPTTALRRIHENSKYAFDFDLFTQFIQTIGIYPVGSLVRLQSGFLAIVVESGKDNPLQPIVRIIYDIRKQMLIPPRNLDLSQGVGELHKIVSNESAAKWKLNPADYIQLPKF